MSTVTFLAQAPTRELPSRLVTAAAAAYHMLRESMRNTAAAKFYYALRTPLRRSAAEAVSAERAALMRQADSYEATQPGFAADLRAAAQRAPRGMAG